MARQLIPRISPAMLKHNPDQVTEILNRAIDEINADGAYKMIVNATALLDAADELDITSIVLDKVNALYAADKAAAKSAK